MSQRLNIFLDLDNTIICSETYNQKIMSQVYDYDYDFINPYVTVARPHLQKFLDFIFKYHNVNIWTAASKNYASFIYDRFVKKYDNNRNIGLLLYNKHCDVSMSETGHTKSLSMLWEQWNLVNFNSKNTYIIDDLREVYITQPQNCLPIKPFNIKDGKDDTELLKMIEKIKSINI